MEELPELQAIQKRLKDSVGEYRTFWHGFAYNGVTVASLALSAFAAAAANWGSGYAPYVSAASAAAAFLITVERSLDLGARWRFFREMRSSYRHLVDGLDFYRVLPRERRETFINDWWATLVALRKREGDVPGIGGGNNK